VLTTLLLAELVTILTGPLVLPYLLYYAYIRTKVHSSAPYHSSRSDVKVSILICVLNAAEAIQKKIEEILHQSHRLKSVELIVIDGGSTDETVEILDEMKRAVPEEIAFKVISGRAFAGKASQINEGFRVSSGPIVITTDVDCATDSNAIRILVDSLSENGVGAVCSRQVLTNPDQSLPTETEATYRHFYETLRIGESNLHSTPIYHGGLSGYRKDAYSPIDEDVNADDTQLALAAIRKGFRAIYEPRSVFYAESPSGPADSLRQRIRRGQGLQRVFWRNRDLLFNAEFGRFGSIIFPATFFMHLISPLILSVEIALLIMLLISLGSYSVTALVSEILAMLGLLSLTYLRRSSRPNALLLTFVAYQMALICAMLLHLFGQNYERWSGSQRL